MKKIFIVFMVILLLGLSVVPSFAAYSSSVEVEDNDTDVSQLYYETTDLYAPYLCVTPRLFQSFSQFGLTFTNNGDGSFDLTGTVTSTPSYNQFSFSLDYTFPRDGTAYFLTCSVDSVKFGISGYTPYSSSFYYRPYSSSSWLGRLYIFCSLGDVFDLHNVVINVFELPVTPYSIGDRPLSISYFPSLSSDFYYSPGQTYGVNKVSLVDNVNIPTSLFGPLSSVKFYNDGINNRGLYVQAFSDSDFLTDITSDVATSSGLSVDSDGLIYLEFEDGETVQLFYDGTVYYQVTLDPSPPYMYVNFYRHIFENFAGTYTFITEDNWIFITCVSSIAICFVIFVAVFFFKRFSH